MSGAAQATVSIIVYIGGVVVMVAAGSTLATVAGGAIVAAGLVVFIRTVIRLAGESTAR